MYVNAKSMQERLPPLIDEELTDAQRAAAQAVANGPRGSARGPFAVMLRSPEFMDRTQRLGEFLRFNCSVPIALREFVILICASEWRQSYEWAIHAPLAESAGVSAQIIGDLARQRTPTDLDADQDTVYRFCNELTEYHAVSDPTYARAVELLGEAGVVELCGICGYYSMLAMVMNVARTEPPGGGLEPPFPLPETPDAN